MKKQILNISFCLFILLVCACRKEVADQPASTLSGIKYLIHANNVKVAWDKPVGAYEYFDVELSQLADFSILDDTKQVTETAHVFRNLKAGATYFVRVKPSNSKIEGEVVWNTIQFQVLPSNVLLPVADTDIDGKKVTLKWDFMDSVSALSASATSKLVLSPLLGHDVEIVITPAHIEASQVLVGDLQTDMQYTARLYNGSFVAGVQTFTTLAMPVNGVWTLNPYSDVKSAVEDSEDGDVLILKPGVYNVWQNKMVVDNKSLTIKALGSQKPKLYAMGFALSGAKSGLLLQGLDISGARLDEYKEEIPNTADTRWNERFATLEGEASVLDHLAIEDCIVRNYWTGLLKIDGNTQLTNAVTIHNSIVHHIGGDNTVESIAVNRATLHQAIFSNSTFYKINKLFISLDREPSGTSNDLVFVFKNNTVDDSWNSGSFNFKAMKAPAKVLLQNNIFSNIAATVNFFGNFSYVANNFEKRLINCNFYNVTSKQTIYGSNQSNMPVHSWELRHPNLIWTEVVPAFVRNDEMDVNPNSVKEYPVSFNPGYKNPALLDFTVSPSSPLRSLDNGNPIGDPRWW